MGQPSEYFPGIFTLDNGPVQAVQTSETYPKTRMDATGLILPADYTGNHKNTVQWRDNNGILVAEIVASNPVAAMLNLNAWSPDQSSNSQLTLQPKAGAQPGIVRAHADGNDRYIIDSSGRSDFFQQLLAQGSAQGDNQIGGLPGNQAMRITGGYHSISWPGGTSFSNLTAIGHGLAAAPKVAIAVMQHPPGITPLVCVVESSDAVNINVRAYTNPSTVTVGALTYHFFWLAIG